MKNDQLTDRRGFLMKLGVGMGALAATIAAIPIVGAIVAPVFSRRKHAWRDVGDAARFAIGTTTLVTFINADPTPYAGVTAKSAAWIRRNGDGDFIAFSANCTHLGCPVRWDADAELFMCPCHGGVYYSDGSVAAGPPPRHLQQYMIRLNKGRVQVRTAPVPITNMTDNNKA